MVVRNIFSAAAALSSPTTCLDVRDCRTISSIVYNCASTLHLNVPKDPWEGWWKRLFRRVGWMILALLAPEAVFFRAFVQWAGSSYQLTKKLKSDPSCKWTEAHAMLARMGGICLVDNNGSKRREYMLSDVPSDVEMPTVEEIQDKGKGDDVAKTIAIIQTLWFAIQAAHRVSQGLIVTELELSTLGHVVLNVFIYWCWWNKPLNVRFPVDLHLRKRGERELREEQSPNNDQERVEEGGNAESQTPTARVLSIRTRMGAYAGRLFLDDTGDIGDGDALVGLAITLVIFPVIGGAFGAIHCLAWNSAFPSHIEHTLWRVSALCVTTIPFLGFVTFFLAEDTSKTVKYPLKFTCYALASVYCIARTCLLVVALTTLRDLQYRAYKTPSWTAFIPHIG